MAQAPKALVKPKVLLWLRETSGLSIEETARKLRTKPDNLAAWEAGEKRPSMPQLRKLANAYRRPIHYFYLPQPVAEPSIPHDFRRLPEASGRSYSPALLHEIRTAYRRRSLALDLTKEAGRDIPVLDAIGTASLDDDPELLGQRLRDLVGLTFEEQSRWKEPRRAYNEWRTRIEALGTLVFQITTVDLSEMLGFSLAEKELPVIGINRKNSLNGRTFTLLHEFTHLMLVEGSLCDIDDALHRNPREQEVEVFCNHVAGAAMVPRNELLSHPMVKESGTQSRDWGEDIIASLSSSFGASEEVIVRRLLINQLTTREFYEHKRAEYRARNTPSKRQQAGGKIRRNMPQEAVSNLSSFARIVLDSYNAKAINLSEAAQHLGVRADKVATVASRVSVEPTHLS